MTLYSNSSDYSLSEIIIFDPIHMELSGEYECTASGQKNNLTATKHVTIDVKGIISIKIVIFVNAALLLLLLLAV